MQTWTRDTTERKNLRLRLQRWMESPRAQGCRQSLEIVKKQGNGFFLPLEYLGGVRCCGHLAQWDSFPISDFQYCERMFCFNPLYGNVLQQQEGANTQGLCELLRQLSGKEPACQCRRHRFDPRFGKIPWRMKWLPTPEFLLGRSHGQRSLVGYSPWGGKELDITLWINSNNCVWSPWHILGTWMGDRRDWMNEN